MSFDKKVIDYVRNLSLQGKATSVAEVAEQFIFLHPNAVAAILKRGVKHGVLSRRYSQAMRKYYYVHVEASAEYGKTYDAWWRRLKRWLQRRF